MAGFGNGTAASPLMIPEISITPDNGSSGSNFGSGPMPSMPPDVPGMNAMMVNMQLVRNHGQMIGSHFSGLKGLPVQAQYTPAQVDQYQTILAANYATMAAVVDLTADVLAGTVPPNDLAILTGAHVPLQFIGKDTLRVGGAGAGGWDYHAPSPFAHTDVHAAGYAGISSSLSDWGVMIGATIGLVTAGITVAAGGSTVIAMLGAASALSGAAFSGSYTRVAHDIAWGIDMFAAHGNVQQASSIMAGAPL